MRPIDARLMDYLWFFMVSMWALIITTEVHRWRKARRNQRELDEFVRRHYRL
jgi:hypothetical protein